MAALSALRAHYFKVEDTINWMQNSNNNKIASNASVSIMKSLLYKKNNIDFYYFGQIVSATLESNKYIFIIAPWVN